MALTYNEAVEQTIISGEQLYQIVNGTGTTEIIVEDGSSIPSIRKALVDNFYFKDPIDWVQGQTETVFNQIRRFTDGSWWYAPIATSSNPISMGSTPIGDPLWHIYSLDAVVKLTPQIRESLRRSYAEADYTLVDGSFGLGGTVTSTTDVLLYENDGRAYNFNGTIPVEGIDVPGGSTPATAGGIGPTGWMDVSAKSLFGILQNDSGFFDFGSLPSIANLKTHIGVTLGDKVTVDSYFLGESKGGGRFYWDPDLSEWDDGYHIKTSASLGGWTRIHSGDCVFLSEYGVKPSTPDSSPAVLAAITMASSLGKTLVLDSAALVQAVTVTGLPGVKIKGKGPLKVIDNSNKVALYFKECDGLSVFGVELDGNKSNQTSTSQAGMPSDGIGLIRIEQCNNWAVEHCDIHDNRLGAAVLIVDNGTNSSTNWQGSLQNGFLHKNYIHDNGVAGIVMSDGVFSWSHSTTISDNVIRRCTDYGIALDYSERGVVKGNIISDVYVVMGILGVDDMLIDGNNYDSAELGIAVTLSGNPSANPFISRNVTITNNKGANISSPSLLADGIFVDPSCENVTINNNTIRNAKRGIAVPCESATIIGNSVIDCTDMSYYVTSKRGTFNDNSAYNSDGSTPVPSYISGQSNKSVCTQAAGKQSSLFRKNVGTSPVRLCNFTADGPYAGALITVEFAGLINSLGVKIARRTFMVAKSAGLYSVGVVPAEDVGDVSSVIIDVNTSVGGIPTLFVSFATGSLTETCFNVKCFSSGLQDDVIYITSE